MDSVAKNFVESPASQRNNEDDFNLVYKTLTNSEIKSDISVEESKQLIIQLNHELESTYASYTKASAYSEQQAKRNGILEARVNDLNKKLREQAARQQEKEAALNKMNTQLTEAREKNQEMQSMIQLLQKGHASDIMQYQSQILEEKELHLQRMRAQIANCQMQLKRANDKRYTRQEAVRDLAHKVARIKQEYEHLGSGIARHFQELRMYMQIQCVSPIQKVLSAAKHQQNVLIEEQRINRLIGSAVDTERVQIFARVKPLLITGTAARGYKLEDRTNRSIVQVLGISIHKLANVCIRLLTLEALIFLGKQNIAVHSGGNAAPLQFKFDRVFSENSNQREVYIDISPQIPLTVTGDHVAIIAAGQQGCGKHYTLHGAIGNEGLIFLALQDLFKSIQEFESKKKGSKVQVSISAFHVCTERGKGFI